MMTCLQTICLLILSLRTDIESQLAYEIPGDLDGVKTSGDESADLP